MNLHIERTIQKKLIKSLEPNKVLVLLGPRRTGKTFFLRRIIDNELGGKVLELTGEDSSTIELLEQKTVSNYTRLIGDNEFLVIDEAQKIPEIGQKLKLIIDHVPGVKVFVTGSSAFDLSNKLGEPLTGRKKTFLLLPFSQQEYSTNENLVETIARLEERLIFGNYPELIHLTGNAEKIDYLHELTSSYLLKDILEYDGIKNSSVLLKVLRLLAFQTGKNVSLEELGRQAGISRNTVEKYLDLLTKVFVIYYLPGFSNNLRKEISKTHKWYFYDNGVRNALINNFNSLSMRNDTGELWEGYLLSERIKYQKYNGLHVNSYYWRNYQQQEIDLIEEKDGLLHAFEMKWNPHKTAKIPSSWKNHYPNSTFQVIHKGNYLDFILGELG